MQLELFAPLMKRADVALQLSPRQFTDRAALHRGRRVILLGPVALTDFECHDRLLVNCQQARLSTNLLASQPTQPGWIKPRTDPDQRLWRSANSKPLIA